MEKQFEVIDHTADIGIVAYGRDLPGLLANAARGMYSLMVDSKKIEARLSKTLELDEGDPEALLVEWLNTLLYELDTERLLFRDFAIVIKDGRKLTATCAGEKLDLKKHRLRREVKAATYHNLKIENKEGLYTASIIFDI